MSAVKRYRAYSYDEWGVTFTKFEESEDGEWVKYEDYVELEKDRSNENSMER